MLQSLKRVTSKFWKFISKRDIYVVIFALILMHNLHMIVEIFYPVTGEPSMSWIYYTVFGLTRGSIIVGYAYLMFRIFFPTPYRYLEDSFSSDFKKLEWRKKLYVGLLLYAFILAFFLVSAVTM